MKEKYVCKKDFEINGVLIGHKGDVLVITDAKPSSGQTKEDVAGYCDIENTVTKQRFEAAWMDIGDELNLLTVDPQIVFDERYDDEESETTTLYFIAPKEILSEYGFEYPEAVSAEISLEFPIDVLVAEHAYEQISPTDANGSDYDWNDIELPYNTICDLIELAEKNEKNGGK